MQEKSHLDPWVEVAASKIRSWAVVVWKELAVYWNLAVQRDPALGQMSTIYNKYLNSYEWADSRSAEVSSRKHDLARSWFQIWPIFGDEGDKLSKNIWWGVDAEKNIIAENLLKMKYKPWGWFPGQGSRGKEEKSKHYSAFCRIST